MANVTVRRGNEPPIVVSEQAWNDVYSKNGFTQVSGSASPTPAPTSVQSSPVQSAPVQSAPVQSSPAVSSAPVSPPGRVPPGYVQITDDQVRQIMNGNSTDFEDYYPLSSVGGGVINVTNYAKPIPKAVVVNSSGQRVTVRTDGKTGTLLPVMQDLINQGYRQEASPGVPMQPFTSTSQNTQQTQTSGAVDQRQNPVILLADGRYIRSTDPNYSQYLTIPGSIQINPQTNQVIPTAVGNVQTFADGSQLNIQTGQPIRGSYSGAVPTGSSTMPTGPTSSGTTTPIPTAPQQDFSSDGSSPVSSTVSQAGTAFTGQHLVKFTTDPNGAAEGDASTVWLVDDATKSLRPFMSMSAINNYFGSTAPQALASITTMPVTALSDTGSLARFRTLDHTNGIQSDGTMLNPSVSVAGLQSHYGNTSTPTEQEQLKARAVDILKAIKLNTDNLLANGTLKGFTQQSLNAVFSDSTSLARLINAVAFGNYNGNDITKEAVRLAMVKDGHTELANQSLISDTQNKATYAATDAYKKADALPALAIPGDAAAKIMAATTRPEEFQAGVVTDLTSMKANIDKIGTTYYDLIDQANSATTEHDHQVAQTNWDNFRKTLQQQFGVTVAKNAVDAWGQIQALQKTVASGGLSGSGMANELIDQYLKQVRASDRVSRMDKLNQSEKQEMTFYTSSASPDQVAALIAADQASGLPHDQWKSVKYGLIPSDQLKQAFDVNTIFQKLKAEKPDQPDWLLMKQAQLSHDSVLDKNGNLMSSLYGNLVSKQNENASNKLVFQQGAAMADINKQNNAIFDQYTDPGLSSENTFSQSQGSGLPSSTTPTSPEPSSTTTPTPPPVTSTTYTPPAQVTSNPYTPPAPVTSTPYVAPPSSSDSLKKLAPIATSIGSALSTPTDLTNIYGKAASVASSIASAFGSPSKTPSPSTPVTSSSPTTSGKKATLYGPNNTPVVVDVGSAQASQLQSQGWGLTKGSYKTPVTSSGITAKPTI